ncbi:MAG: hypothetical protein H0X24_16150 [Ktedonobacterales bacterium]|nr:hypothetical protein [Ktedonobacterales bacterium]
MAESRRGRKSQSDYKVLVGKALTLLGDLFALDEFPILSQLPAVEQWAAAHHHDLLPHGKGLRALLQHAVALVIEKIGDEESGTSARLVQYLQLRYQQGLLVKDIAERWSLSAEQVWRSSGRRALELVTDQFLEIARCSDQKPKLVAPDPRPQKLPTIG